MTIRKLLIGAAAAAAFAGLAGAADAAATDTSTASAAIQITIPNTVKKTADIDFGVIARQTDGNNSVVTVGNASATSGVKVDSGAATIVSGGSAHPAAFVVTGNGSGGGLTATLDFPGNTSQFGALTATPSTSTLALTSSNNYSQTVYVGGSITVLPTTAPNSYTGTLTLNVTYP